MADTQTWQDILDVDDVRDEADFADMTTDAIQSQYAHAKRIRGVAEKVRQEIDQHKIWWICTAWSRTCRPRRASILIGGVSASAWTGF